MHCFVQHLHHLVKSPHGKACQSTARQKWRPLGECTAQQFVNKSSKVDWISWIGLCSWSYVFRHIGPQTCVSPRALGVLWKALQYRTCNQSTALSAFSYSSHLKTSLQRKRMQKKGKIKTTQGSRQSVRPSFWNHWAHWIQYDSMIQFDVYRVYRFIGIPHGPIPSNTVTAGRAAPSALQSFRFVRCFCQALAALESAPDSVRTRKNTFGSFHCFRNFGAGTFCASKIGWSRDDLGAPPKNQTQSDQWTANRFKQHNSIEFLGCLFANDLANCISTVLIFSDIF